MFSTYLKEAFPACDAACAPSAFSCSESYESYILTVLSTAVFAVLIFIISIILVIPTVLLGLIPVNLVVLGLIVGIGIIKRQSHLSSC